MVPSEHVFPLNESLPPRKKQRVVDKREAFTKLENTFISRASEIIRQINSYNIIFTNSIAENKNSLTFLEETVRENLNCEDKIERKLKILIKTIFDITMSQPKEINDSLNSTPEGMYI